MNENLTNIIKAAIDDEPLTAGTIFKKEVSGRFLNSLKSKKVEISQNIMKENLGESSSLNEKTQKKVFQNAKMRGKTAPLVAFNEAPKWAKSFTAEVVGDGVSVTYYDNFDGGDSKFEDPEMQGSERDE